MSIIKYIGRLKKMDDLIRRKATGTPEEFAEKLGLNRAMLMENIRELRELGASISYSRCRRSYYYEVEFSLIIGQLPDNNVRNVKGGINFQMALLYPVDISFCKW